jgi:ABC-type transport system substrate-binding protein
MASLRTRVSGGDFEATLAGWRWTGTPALGPLFGSGSRPPKGSNVVGYHAADADEALAAAASAAEWKDAQAALARVQQTLHRDQPCTFLWEAQRLAAVSGRVQGATVPVPSDPLHWLASASIVPR